MTGVDIRRRGDALTGEVLRSLQDFDGNEYKVEVELEFQMVGGATPAASFYAGVITQLFHVPLGITSVRFIAGTSTWSQHCLTGDTLVATWDGPRRVGDMAGGEARLLTKSPKSERDRGRWVDAPISSYGPDDVHAVHLSMWGREKTVKATAAHRWFVWRGERGKQAIHEVATTDLLAGDRMLSVFPQHVGRIKPSPYGIAAGLVFGDGHLESSERGGATIRLWGADRDLLRYFPQDCPTTARELDTGVMGIEVRGMPRSFKGYPSLDESTAFLAGWLAGYIAADGSVKGRDVSLASSTLEHLEFASLVASRVGIAARAPKVQKRGEGSYPGTEDSWQMQFVRDTVPDWLLIVPDELEEFRTATEALVQPSRAGCWGVVDVEPAGREEVFCATVPATGAFALDGWLLTGNSYGNAVDAMSTGALLRQIAYFVDGNRELFSIAHLLADPYFPSPLGDHYFHVHSDFHPLWGGTPPGHPIE